MLSDKEKEIIVKLIFKEQTRLIGIGDKAYESGAYKELEKLKIKIKGM